MNVKWKQVLLIFLLIAAILILFLLFLLLGNRLLPQQYTAEQYLLWLLSGFLSFIGVPSIAFINHTRQGGVQGKGERWHRADNLFFTGVCLPVAILLFWAFGSLDHHRAIYNFFTGIFGIGWRGYPNFPIPLLSFLVFIVFALAELLHNKIRYKVYEFPEFPDPERQETFRRRRALFYSIAFAAWVICFISYYLKWVIKLK